MKATQRMINFLLENANPSIVYRIKKEILQNISEVEEKKLQELILSENIVQSIVACQKENGWLGNGFHGSNKNAGRYENQETGIKYLAEKGVHKKSDVLKRAMEAFVEVPLTDPCYRTKGKLFDEFKYAANGQNIIRCACIARAGYDNIIDISPQIQLSLDSFQRVLEVDSILDISRPVKNRNKRVFYNFEKWPCRYHLDILAHTNSWKTQDNCAMLAEAVHKIMRDDCPELIGVTADSWVGYVLGTVGCFPSQGFSVIKEKNGISCYNLEYLVWLARCGIIRYSSILQEVVETIVKEVNEEGICEISVEEDIFRGWGPYGGLQLEIDWKSRIRRNCDITFRVLQLCYYAGVDLYE